jgi:hypothetical protein
MCAKRKKQKSIMDEEQKKINTFNEFVGLLSNQNQNQNQF